jgi:hypothetical protein
MINLTHTAIVTSGVRGLVCAGLSTLITAFFSWSFVASTDSLNWMGSSEFAAAGIAMLRSDGGLQSGGA